MRALPSPWFAARNELFPGSARFIVFEGIDGSGKSTQARLLAGRLEHFSPVTFTAEPSDGPAGKRIRALIERPGPLEEAQLFLEDRRYHMKHVIRPALDEGMTVICDRYVYSSVAYQGARGVPIDDILAWHVDFAVAPDAIILMETDVPSALDRIDAGRDRMSLFEERKYLEDVAAIYRDLDDRLIVRINALGEAGAIHDGIVAALQQKGVVSID